MRQTLSFARGAADLRLAGLKAEYTPFRVYALTSWCVFVPDGGVGSTSDGFILAPPTLLAPS